MKKYQIIYADPPWTYNDKLGTDRATMGGYDKYYKGMPLAEIAKLPVHEISDKDCVLFLWVTMPMLPNAFQIIDAWGFTYKTVAFTWVKQNKVADTIFKGVGRWVQGNAELVLLATKGKPHRVSKSVSQIIMSHRREHSRKPDEARDSIIKLMGDVPRIELFAREKTPGWDVWGNEVISDISLAPKGLTRGGKMINIAIPKDFKPPICRKCGVPVYLEWHKGVLTLRCGTCDNNPIIFTQEEEYPKTVAWGLSEEGEK